MFPCPRNLTRPAPSVDQLRQRVREKSAVIPIAHLLTLPLGSVVTEREFSKMSRKTLEWSAEDRALGKKKWKPLLLALVQMQATRTGDPHLGFVYSNT